jgi:hypothetical protein
LIDISNEFPGIFRMDTEAVDTRLIAWNERWAVTRRL